MRNRFDNQLEKLNNELIEMGSMIEQAIEKAISALVNNDVELAKTVIEGDEDIDHQERRIESLCMKLLLQQQPVAKDFRLISSALKMITDMERIGDHAADISEMTVWIYGENYVTHLNLLEEMAKEVTVMLVGSIDAFVCKNLWRISTNTAPTASTRASSSAARFSAHRLRATCSQRKLLSTRADFRYR